MIANLIRYLASMLPFSLSFRPVLYRISGMKIGKYVINRFGFKLDEYELSSNVRAYLHYFKKKESK